MTVRATMRGMANSMVSIPRSAEVVAEERKRAELRALDGHTPSGGSDGGVYWPGVLVWGTFFGWALALVALIVYVAVSFL